MLIEPPLRGASWGCSEGPRQSLLGAGVASCLAARWSWQPSARSLGWAAGDARRGAAALGFVCSRRWLSQLVWAGSAPVELQQWEAPSLTRSAGSSSTFRCGLPQMLLGRREKSCLRWWSCPTSLCPCPTSVCPCPTSPCPCPPASASTQPISASAHQPLFLPHQPLLLPKQPLPLPHHLCSCPTTLCPAP